MDICPGNLKIFTNIVSFFLGEMGITKIRFQQGLGEDKDKEILTENEIGLNYWESWVQR